jgi:urease accessory protein
MASACRAQLASHQEAHDAFKPGAGVPEITMAWQIGKVWCRARLDWLPQEAILFGQAHLGRTLEADLAPDATLIACDRSPAVMAEQSMPIRAA